MNRFPLSDLQVAFAMFDKDGDGSITTQELRDVMKSLNIDINKRDVKRLIKKIDKDGKTLAMPCHSPQS